MNEKLTSEELARLLEQRAKPETENDLRRRYGLPKWLKRYHARYGRGGIQAIVVTHRQNRGVPPLDNGRDRRERKRDGNT